MRDLKALCVALILALMMVWPAPGALYGAAKGTRAERKAPPPGVPFGWSIRNSRVVDQGKVTELPEGTLVTGYTIKGAAVPRGSAPVKRGAITLIMSMFAPRQDLPGQKAGQWQVRGKWTITGYKASEAARKARHSPEVVKGTLTATLPFNPATTHGIVDAQVKLPHLAAGGGNGRGAFRGNERFEGNLDLALQR